MISLSLNKIQTRNQPLSKAFSTFI